MDIDERDDPADYRAVDEQDDSVAEFWRECYAECLDSWVKQEAEVARLQSDNAVLLHEGDVVRQENNRIQNENDALRALREAVLRLALPEFYGDGTLGMMLYIAADDAKVLRAALEAAAGEGA